MKKLPVLQHQSLAQLRVHRSIKGQEFIDGLINNDVNTTCVKGCSHCCSHPIHISLAEGILLYWHLRNNDIWTKSLEFELEKHARSVAGLAPEIWLLSDIPCPLLKDSLCTAYSARPFVCRTTFSMGMPDDCNPSNFSEDTRLVNRAAALEEFHTKEKGLVDAGKARNWLLPISLATLVGADVAEGRTDLDNSYHSILKHYLED